LSDADDAAALDDTRFYCVFGSRNMALRVSDGQPAWTRDLSGPESARALTLVGPWLVLSPSPARLGEAGLGAVVVMLCDPQTGAPVQRFSFGGMVDALACRFEEHAALVATQAQMWLLARGRQSQEP
jgi:hypothetical protein